MSNIVWTPIVKGQRKPPGYVLVTCFYTTSKLEAAIWGGPIETFARINVTRERIRQNEMKAMREMREKARKMGIAFNT